MSNNNISDISNRTIAVLGSTGSVGEQALDVADKFGIKVSCVSANKNSKRVEEQARKFSLSAVAMADERAAADLRVRLADTGVKVYAGENGICEMVGEQKQDTVVNSIIGEAGLLPTLAVIDSGARLALANKESLVVAGEIVMARAKEKGVEILPVDSEHSAIFQCLKSGKHNEIKKILLTASGGPFFGYTKDQMKNIKLSDALAHPTWKMGAKITIDSATMMNKGFEVMEAKWLFGVGASDIEVVVHPQSVIHSMVQFEDGAIKAQLGTPDMRLPIMYALTYPNRLSSSFERIDWRKTGELTFEEPNMELFPNLRHAYEALARGGNIPCVVNAANEICVAAFLNDRIKFTDMPRLIERAMNEAHYILKPILEDYLETDKEIRRRVEEWIN